MELKKAISITQLGRYRFRSMPFEGRWLDTFGRQEARGKWIIWGESGNGKTALAIQLGVYMASLGYKVWYNSLEQGASLTMRNAMIRHGVGDVSRRFYLLDKDDLPALRARLKQKHAADIVIIDSIQHLGINVDDYKSLISDYHNTLYICISHADGKHPRGSVADFIRYDSDVKVRVEGYRAFATGRDVGNKHLTIWDAGAAAYWGSDNADKKEDKQ